MKLKLFCGTMLLLFCWSSNAQTKAAQDECSVKTNKGDFCLLTQKEAADTKQEFEGNRDPGDRLPQIIVEYPRVNDKVQSPFRLRIRFKAVGGAQIDHGSLSVLYFTADRADLTPRLVDHLDAINKQSVFLRENVIDIPKVRAPAGEHQLLISVTYKGEHSGLLGDAVHSFTVGK